MNQEILFHPKEAPDSSTQRDYDGSGAHEQDEDLQIEDYFALNSIESFDDNNYVKEEPVEQKEITEISIKHRRISSNATKKKRVFSPKNVIEKAAKKLKRIKPSIQKKCGDKKLRVKLLNQKKGRKKDTFSPDPRPRNQISGCGNKPLVKDLTSVLSLKNIYTKGQQFNENDRIMKNLKLEKDGLKAYILNKLKLRKLENTVDKGNIQNTPNPQKQSITLKEITQRLVQQSKGQNLASHNKPSLPAHLVKGLSKRAKKMIEAYQIKIKKAVGGRKLSCIESNKASHPSEPDINFSTKTNTFYDDKTDQIKDIKSRKKFQANFSPVCRTIIPLHVTNDTLEMISNDQEEQEIVRRDISLGVRNPSNPNGNLMEITLERITSPHERVTSPMSKGTLAHLFTPKRGLEL
ncbi:unnamed protein product [Moneuplotes crassus]|uniref:Uncharacterized protein n=1 Tax=Euplotes crassus TaxID=5936 RepID=A0AAD1UKJ1_EUPCR|nr:unnamed protein product [Moneuplotes crassus]